MTTVERPAEPDSEPPDPSEPSEHTAPGGGTRNRTNDTSLATGEDLGAMATIRRGLHYSPELKDGIAGTLLLAVLASVGQVIVPIAVQQTLDRGLNGDGGPDTSFTVLMGLVAAGAIGVTTWASYAMTSRLFTTSERGLATLRIKAFRHVHDLPLLTQNTERRGALVSRVTSDVDQVSQFLVFGGLLFIISVGQILIATVVMLVYSWQLTIVVWVCFAPLFLSLRFFQRKLSEAYGIVRHQVGLMLSAISEPVVGAAVVRSYAVEARTQARIDEAVLRHQRASVRAQGYTAFSFSLGGVSAGLANAGVLIVGIWLGFAGDITSGTVLAFAFLVTLFVGPVQMGTQIVTEAQNAIAGWRRVLGILDTPADLVDPGPDGHVLPRGPIDVRFADVGFAYPSGPPVLRAVDLSIGAGRRIAIVGETGSGKSTFAKLLTRLMDPTTGAVLLDGIDVRDISETSLRSSVVLVPQEGFLFDDTISANVRYGRLAATEAEIRASADELGLDDWLAGLPHGLETRVGQRGESLSAGERQLVALLRAHLADPDLLVLDEATSAVDPQLEMRIGRALERLMSGRTSVTIAHRMSTAESADEVVVVDRGRIVQRGPHAVLVAEQGSVYAGLHHSWAAQTASS
jgi:ABC-type multidrug transport system fused ATPase/permease subunit